MPSSFYLGSANQWNDGRWLRGDRVDASKAEGSRVTILFHVTLMTMLRHFEGVLLELAERGHRVRVALPNRRPDLLPPPALAGHASISFVRAPGIEATPGRIRFMSCARCATTCAISTTATTTRRSFGHGRCGRWWRP